MDTDFVFGYKGGEKKYIKNKFFYCFLILFDLYPF